MLPLIHAQISTLCAATLLPHGNASNNNLNSCPSFIISMVLKQHTAMFQNPGRHQPGVGVTKAAVHNNVAAE